MYTDEHLSVDLEESCYPPSSPSDGGAFKHRLPDNSRERFVIPTSDPLDEDYPFESLLSHMTPSKRDIYRYYHRSF